MTTGCGDSDLDADEDDAAAGSGGQRRRRLIELEEGVAAQAYKLAPLPGFTPRPFETLCLQLDALRSAPDFSGLPRVR